MNHCRFLLVPVDGATRLIDQHPTPEAVSDALGGAIPVPIWVGRQNVSAWVRETSATEGLDRNLVAGTFAQVVGGPPLPFLGPVAFTLIAWSPTAGPYLAASAEGFPVEMQAGLMNVCNDLRRAVDGFNDGFVGEGLDGPWAARVRVAADRVREAVIPDGWPHGFAGSPPDPVAVLMRNLGLGSMFAPVSPPISTPS